MAPTSKTGDGPLYILAAGGIVERQDHDARRIAVIRRRRYADRDGEPGDRVLPKGKLEPGESLEEAALREVGEETSCRAQITGPPLFCEYEVRGVPKVVAFFRMTSTGEKTDLDQSEVHAVDWLEPREALSALTYASERDLVARAYPELEVPDEEVGS